MLRPMDESGFDTLKATRALKAAGFASGQAEAMVTVFGGAIVANVATKWDIRDLKGDIRNLKDDIGALRTEVKREIGTLQTELRSEIAEVRLSVDGLKATMYRLLLAQAAVIVGLIFGLQRFL